MLHIEFCDGIAAQGNIAYYTVENVEKFKALAQSLPDSPDVVLQLKNRYLNTELPKIQSSFDRHKNPGEDNARALHNLRATLPSP
jgi:hypothetical protein